MLAACSAQGSPVGDLARPPVDPPAGQVQLLYGASAPLETGEESRYVVLSAAAAPDGTVYVVDDPTSPVAGAESDPSRPRTVVVDSRTGRAVAMEGFSTGGEDIDRPLISVVGPDGSLYVAAGDLDEPARLYVRSPEGTWRREDGWPAEHCAYGSTAPQAIGDDGTLYRTCSGEVQAWTPQDGLRVVAGRRLQAIQRPPLAPVDTRPRPAVGASLPFLVTVVPAPAGLYVISEETVHVVDPDGTLRLVAGQGTPADPGAELFDVRDVDGIGYGSTLRAAAAAAAGGSLLLYDDYLGRLLRLGDDGRLRLLSQTRPAPEALGRTDDAAAQRPVPLADATLAVGSISVMPDGDVLLAGGHRVLRLGATR